MPEIEYRQDGYLYGIHHSSPADLIVQCAFDPWKELLWTGTDSLLTSYVIEPSNPQHHLYTRFPATCLNKTSSSISNTSNLNNTQSIKPVLSKFLMHGDGIYSISSNCIASTSRGGLPQWNYRHDSGLGFTCIAAGSRNGEVVASTQTIRLSVLNHGRLSREIPIEEGLNVMKRDKFISCGGFSGSIYLKDLKTLRTTNSFPAHKKPIADLDVLDNTIVSCAYVERGNPYIMESIVKVFDIRNLSKIVSSFSFDGARFIAINQESPNLVTVASNYGSFLTYDTKTLETLHETSVDTNGSYISTMDLSSSGQRLVLGDMSGYIYLFSSGECPLVNRESSPIELPTPEYRKPVVVDEDTSLNVIGMPYYQHPLYSAHWPLRKRYVVGNPHPAIPEDILDQVKMVDFVGYAPNLGKGKRFRNQVAEVSPNEFYIEPKLKSEKERERSSSNEDNSWLNRKGHDNDHRVTTSATFPPYYKKQKIKYGKFGVEDFDFSFYNSTSFAGLENDIKNCHLNAFIQMMILGYGDGLLRTLLEWHLNGNKFFRCENELCLMCELGFLSKMMRDAEGENCQASNFLRTFSVTKEATILGLLEPEKITPKTPWNLLIQNFHRFMIDRLHQESTGVLLSHPTIEVLNDKKDWSVVQQLCGMLTSTKTSCPACKSNSSRDSVSFSVDLQYPKIFKASPSKSSTHPQSFKDVFQDSLYKFNSTRAWCAGCQSYTIIEQTKTLANLPHILSINCSGVDEDEKNFWKQRDQQFQFNEMKNDLKSSFLPISLHLKLSENVVILDDDGTNYVLSGILCQVENGKDPSHLISILRLKVDGNYRWFLFNDFLVREIPTYEAIQFKSRWKIPAILQYVRCDIESSIDTDSLSISSGTLLERRFSRGLFDLVLHPTDIRGFQPNIDHIIPLQFEEISSSTKPILVAIDAEFVALTREEIEVKSDGSKSVIRPVKMHLARVSLVRGDGDKEGIPFVDDYIYTSEPISDYLTEYSGIVPGDLDMSYSARTLVSLKNVYRKIRFLLDSKVVFVGHGLKSDFRTINIYVKPSQVIDTLDIFRKEGKRKISLRFLSWYVLEKDIQSQSHDSIVDAKIALELYKKYLKLEKEGKFDNYLDRLYEEGRNLNWRAPHWKV